MAEKKESLTFEAAMERLENIISQMEAGTLPLEEMLQRYEDGTRLVKLCTDKLAAAEKRIEIIARNASGKPDVVEFDPASAAAEPPKPNKGTSPDDDIRLF